MSNLVDFIVLGEFVTDAPEPFAPVSLTFDDYVDIADDVDALLERLDIVLTAGTLDPATRAGIRSVLLDIPEAEIRVRVALYLVLISPDYAVRL